MANWHALLADINGNGLQVVYHLAIPGTGNNRAGIQWRTALINSGLGGFTILPDGDGTGGTISSTEKAQITNGALFEYQEMVFTNPGETLAQLQAKVDARWNALNQQGSEVLGAIQGKLTYYGHTH